MRNEWKFRHSSADVADAAQKKANHRNERTRWWEAKKAELMDQVRSSGLEVTESLSMQYSNNSGIGIGPQVRVRYDLQAKLSECHQKIREHSNAAREYEGWVEILTANSGLPLDLDQSDWLYFFSVDVKPTT